MIFNGNSEKNLYQLNDHDSILQNDFFVLNLKKTKFDREFFCNFFSKIDLNIKRSHKYTENLLKEIPKDWNIDKIEQMDFLSDNIFSKYWISETKENFKKIISSAIK